MKRKNKFVNFIGKSDVLKLISVFLFKFSLGTLLVKL